MFTLPRENIFKYLSRHLPTLSSTPISLPNVAIHDIETSSDRRARTLKHLIKANHANFSVIYHNLQFQNHAPHILGSAFLLGADGEHLNRIYESESQELEGWTDAPGEIVGGEDWKGFLGMKEYQRAFIDFFEDQLVQHGYDWQALLRTYLYEGDEPLINNLIGNLGHPLIHLAYAYELSSRTIAIEALAVACCFHNFLHKYLDDPSYIKPAPASLSSNDPLSLLSEIRQDSRFDIFPHPGNGDLESLFEKREDAILEYWNAWTISSPKDQFEQSQKMAVALLMGSHESSSKFDFFLVHLLTTSHAVRVLLPTVPTRLQLPLVRQWWLLTIAIYIHQGRPNVDEGRIDRVELKGRDWKHVEQIALTGRHALDSHFVKALRAMKEAAGTWSDPTGFYLKAAVSFAAEFDGWGGFA